MLAMFVYILSVQAYTVACYANERHIWYFYRNIAVLLVLVPHLKFRMRQNLVMRLTNNTHLIAIIRAKTCTELHISMHHSSWQSDTGSYKGDEEWQTAADRADVIQTSITCPAVQYWRQLVGSCYLPYHSEPYGIWLENEWYLYQKSYQAICAKIILLINNMIFGQICPIPSTQYVIFKFWFLILHMAGMTQVVP